MDFGVSENKRIFRGLTSPNLLFLCSVRKLREWHISYPGTQARDLVAFFMSSLSFIPYLWRCSVTSMYPFVSFLSVILSTFLQLHTATSVHICNVSHWLPEFAASRLSQSHLTHCRQIHLFKMYIWSCHFSAFNFNYSPLSSEWRPSSLLHISLATCLPTPCHLSPSLTEIFVLP